MQSVSAVLLAALSSRCHPFRKNAPPVLHRASNPESHSSCWVLERHQYAETFPQPPSQPG